ncbi:hypothetical protein IPL68_08050 [Candidatus Saccharibacteria bacterium]|nr:MAG: hypothetical protein IPL68_08050 [Candidatus Saccharibacteria bacterium]
MTKRPVVSTAKVSTPFIRHLNGHAGRTTLSSLYRLSTIQSVDTIITLKNGRVDEQDRQISSRQVVACTTNFSSYSKATPPLTQSASSSMSCRVEYPQGTCLKCLLLGLCRWGYMCQTGGNVMEGLYVDNATAR